MGSYLTGAATAALFAFIAGAWAANDGLFSDDTDSVGAPHQGQAVEAISVDDQTPHDFTPREAETDHVPAPAVHDPERILTNLTVYADGRDIGHIRSIELNPQGEAARVEIAFNDGQSTAWVDAKSIAYDAAHRRAVTALDPGEMKALEHARFH